jgi:cytochrome c oxidase subunit 2
MTTTFRRPGEYLIVCNEYCGLAHHLMQAKVVVEETR